VPIGPKLSLKQYYNHLAKSRNVLSPDGNRPECYRHYEAIAFGAVPITELDPYHYRHLGKAPVVYNNTNWDITGPTALRLLGLKRFPRVNRNMMFEEYWMEYVERMVGTRLRWWDRSAQKRSFLPDFELAAESSSGTSFTIFQKQSTH